MSLILSHCTPSDAPAYAEAVISTYERQPRHIVTMGSIPRDRQVEMYTALFRELIESQAHPTPNKETHCLKVTDPATNEMAAYAMWDYLPNGYKVEEDGFANVKEVPEGANEKMMRDFGRMTGEIRGCHEGRKGPHWLQASRGRLISMRGQVLSLLGTHPKHERRGAGTMLIRWAFPRADKDQKKCYVDGSSVGYQLYKRCGFEDIGQSLSVDLDQYGDEGFGVRTWTAMLREPQSVTAIE